MRTSSTSLFALAAIVQVAGITLIPVASYTVVYFAMCASILGAIAAWDRSAGFGYALICLFGAFVPIGLTLPFVWHGPGDLMAIFILLPVIGAVAPPVLAKRVPALFQPTSIGLFCFAGATGALAFGLHDIFALHIPRAGVGNNPIHYAGLSVLVGFSALVGLFGSRSQWRFLFLLGPVFGTGAALLSGSRGPVLSAAILALATGPFILWWFWREVGLRISVAGALLVVLAAAFYAPSTQSVQRAFATFDDIANMAENGQVDSSTQERLIIYHGAIGAFFDAPIFGHGISHIVRAAQKHEPPDHKIGYDHLHSDIFDFGVMGGAFGLLAYALFLLAPFAALADRRCVQRRAVLLLGLIISLGFLTLGLTNAVLGVLPQTVLFGILLGNCLAMAQATNTWDPNDMAS